MNLPSRSVSLATTPLAVSPHHRAHYAHFRVFPRGFLRSRHAPVCPRLDFPLVHPTSGAADLSLSGQKVSDSFGPPPKSPNVRKIMRQRFLQKQAFGRAISICRKAGSSRFSCKWSARPSPSDVVANPATSRDNAGHLTWPTGAAILKPVMWQRLDQGNDG